MVNYLEVKFFVFILLLYVKYKVFNYFRWFLVWIIELKGKVGICFELVFWRYRLVFCFFYGINFYSSVIFNVVGSY